MIGWVGVWDLDATAQRGATQTLASVMSPVQDGSALDFPASFLYNESKWHSNLFMSIVPVNVS